MPSLLCTWRLEEEGSPDIFVPTGLTALSSCVCTEQPLSLDQNGMKKESIWSGWSVLSPRIADNKGLVL